MNKLIILRGASGCGKSSFADFLVRNLRLDADRFEADGYMVNRQGDYEFKPEKLGYCHKSCQEDVEGAMHGGLECVIVSNTSTTEKELEFYLDLAQKYDYEVISLVVEKRHDGKNDHEVPEQTLDRQEQRLRGSLKLR